jgi:hypothetical protein
MALMMCLLVQNIYINCLPYLCGTSDHSMQMRARNESSLQSYQVAASLSFHNENHVNTIPNPDSELWWTLE